MSDFLPFITTFICCVKQMKQELISSAHSSLLISIFEISKSGYLCVILETNCMGKLKLQLCGELCGVIEVFASPKNNLH